ncbi:MAG: hypothetical protein AAFN48_08355 [Pseudomonadota bacterium]
MVKLSIHGNYPVEDLPEEYSAIMSRVRDTLTVIDGNGEERPATNFEELPILIKALESRLTYRLSLLNSLLDQQAEEMLEGSEISLRDFRVMNLINAVGSVSVSDIATFCVLEREEVRVLTSKLAKDGLIEFVPDPHIRRKKVIVLTCEGEETLNEIHPMFAERNRDLDALLGPVRKAKFFETLNLLTRSAMP